MNETRPPRLDHLRRLTDGRGLIHSARADFPDRFAGYDSIDNADALRLCALASNMVEVEILSELAKNYYAFLSRARRHDDRVRHACDDVSKWSDQSDDSLVQSRLARALSAVLVSELPISMRLSVADWWPVLIEHADRARTPIAAANWLIAIGQLRSADPGRDLQRAESLARWLVEDCYYPIRSSDWEWFEPRWVPTAACIPTGLWYAHDMLGERRYASIARTTTQFVIEHLFEDGLFLPVGSCGGWPRLSSKALFDQLPAETCSIVELLCAAEQISGSQRFGQFAKFAARWFTGNNLRGQNMIDPDSGGCYEAITADGTNMNQGAPATLAYLLTQATLASRPLIIEEPTVYTTAF